METEFLKMDLFFFITSTVVVLMGLFGLIILFYIIKIVRAASRLIGTVQREADEIAEDFKEIKKDVKEGVHDMKEGISTATNYTKVVAGAGIVKALSALFEAYVEEKEVSTKRKKKRGTKKK